MPTVFANGRSIVHAGDGQVDTAAPPDVCKTPSPGGPVPVPYVNVAKSSDLADGTQSVKIEGSSVAVGSSNLSTSSGDEPGTAGGIISSKNKGKLTWKTKSLDVKFEGEGVVRFGEVTLHNGNTFNTAFMQNGNTGFAYGDDANKNCPICDKSPSDHRILETEDCGAEVEKLIKVLTEAHNKHVVRLAELDNTIKDLETREKLVNEAKKEHKAATRAKAWADATVWKSLQISFQGEYVKAGGDALLQVAKQERASLRPVLRDGKGYMVGIMICCGGKKYAAMSGTETKGFVDVLKCNGWKPCTGQMTAEDAMAGNIRIAKENKSAAFKDEWQRQLKKFEKDSKQYNVPGNCAAQKLAVKAKPHKPGKPKGTISEKWFAPTEPGRAVEVRYRGALAHQELVRQVKAGFERLSIKADLNSFFGVERFIHGNTVPSCGTCQQLLPMLLCDLDSPCC